MPQRNGNRFGRGLVFAAQAIQVVHDFGAFHEGTLHRDGGRDPAAPKEGDRERDGCYALSRDSGERHRGALLQASHQAIPLSNVYAIDLKTDCKTSPCRSNSTRAANCHTFG